MSYSRWGGSDWYSFYNSSSGPIRDEQVLSLWYAGSISLRDWTYGELADITVADIIKEYECSSIEAEEAFGYITQFKQDVDNKSDKELADSFRQYCVTEFGKELE